MLHSLIQAIAKVLIVPTIFLMGLAGYNTHVLSPDMAQQESQYLQSSQLYGGTQPFAGGAYNLAGSGVSSNASTVILTSLTIKQTGQLIQTSDLVGTGGTFYVTLEPGSNTRQEIIGCTGVSQNGASASLTNCSRGLSPVSPYTASTTLQFTHGGGTQVIFSDPPQLFNQYAAVANANTFTAVQTFTAGANPTYTAIPSSFASTDLVPYQTLINTSISGAATSSETNMGISQLATLTQLNANTASSTQGRPLVVPNKLGTSTCQVTGGAFLVSSSTTGKLGGNCFDGTYQYTFTKNDTFSGGITTSGILSTASSTFNTGTLHIGSATIPSPYFGGTGTDGTLSISSGTTTITLTGAVTEKDYTSISMTGTASLNFTGTTTATGNVVILRSQNACTFTSSSLTMIDLRGMGGGMGNAIAAFNSQGGGEPSGGGGGSTGGAGSTGSGTAVAGGAGTISIAGQGGIALPPLASSTRQVLAAGNGTAGATNGGGTNGAGGLGGGGLYIECGGAYTFTTGGFNALGGNGQNGSNGGGNPGGSGGGGGGGGNIEVQAASISADTGTYNVTAGGGGNGGTGTPSGNGGANGAAGSHLEVTNTYFY